MWLRMKEYFSRDYCLRMTLKTMNMFRFKECCFWFSLRQGTMLVAVVELSASSILLFLLLLAVMNTQDIVSMATAELREHENNWINELGDRYNLPFYYLNNERRMLTGQHFATLMLTLTYAGVVLSIIHILSCLMLLYGAVYEISHLLLPWLSTVLLSIVISSLLLTSFVFFQHNQSFVLFYVLILLFIVMESYAWCVVFSFYRELAFKTRNGNIDAIISADLIFSTGKNGKVDV